MDFFTEYQRIIVNNTLQITGEYITDNNNTTEITVDIYKSDEGYNLSINPKNKNYELINILWIAGIIAPKNNAELQIKLENKVRMVKEQNRAIALGLDTSLLLINQVTQIIDIITRKHQQINGLERFPIVVTTQATQYELHHQISSELKKEYYVNEKVREFSLPFKNYNARGRRGVWGRFMHQTIVERFPHILVQTRIPSMLTKMNWEDKAFTLAKVNPTSPVFDNVIFEQFRELASLTNLEVIFATTDSNLARISEQSGIFSIYLEQPLELQTEIILTQRKILWILLTMLYKYDKITIKGDIETEEWMLVKNSRGIKANIYFKRNNKSKSYYSLKVEDKVF